MCFAILSAVGSAVGSLMQYRAQQAQAAAQNAQYERNRINALAAQRDTQKALTLRQLQEDGATKQAMRLSQLDQARRQASAVVTGINSGRSGISLDAIVSDIGRAADENRATMLTNWESTAAQLQSQKDASEATYFQRVNSVSQATEPSPLSPLLGVAGAGLRLYGDYEKQSTARV